jgi:hypothetical protein
MSDLPQPLTPADCDLRDSSVPRDMLVELAMATFGLAADEALALIDTIEPFFPHSISSAGRS